MNVQTAIFLFSFSLFQLILGEPHACSVKCNPCMDLICPEVHVESSSSIPMAPPPSCECHRSCCCSAPPYIPRCPSTIVPHCSTYHYPAYPYPSMPLPQHPPSYCVQSVVVGGKPELREEKKNETMPDMPLLTGPHDDDGYNPCNCKCNVRNPLNNKKEEPIRSCDADRYERYIERLLSVLQNHCVPEPIAPSPMMVVAPHPCPTQLTVKKICKKAPKKYRLASCEEDNEPIVMLEEEQQPTYLVAQPSCCRSRPCCTSCCRPCCSCCC